jgi:hypothetical protein
MTEGWDGNGIHPVTYLRENGWTQGQLVSATGEVCIMGATHNMTPDVILGTTVLTDSCWRHSSIEETIATLAACDEVRPKLGGWFNLPDFNDSVETTYEDVEMVLVKVYGEPL